MPSKLLIPLCAVALIGCARHTIPQVTLIPQTRLGTEDFGPGIVSYTSAGMDFVLDASAHVIVLRVSDSRGVETAQPLRSGDRSTELARGKHEERLALMEWRGSAVTAARNLPEALVGGRTTRWAAYYVLLSDSSKRKSGN